MKTALAWLLPLLTSSVTIGFFYMMSVRSPRLSAPAGSAHLATAVWIAGFAIALNVLAVLIFGVIAARRERRS